MSETESPSIAKIESLETKLQEIYQQVYPLLKTADKSKLSAKLTADIENLKPPGKIEAAETAAILKAMIGSTTEDKFQLENCYSIKMPDGESASGFVRAQLKLIGIEYHDFWPYLRKYGWLTESSTGAKLTA